VRTAIFVYDGFQGLDVVGPLEVLHCARALREQSGGELPSYEPVTVGPSRAPVRSESGLQIVPELALDEVGEVHTLLVPGGQGIAQRLTEPALVQGLRGLAARSTRLVSVCTGAFLLAGCGLLDGRRATTHHHHLDELRSVATACTVESNRVFVMDGPVCSSAGVTTGIDLFLHRIAMACGPALAAQVAQAMVVALRRGPNDPELSPFLRHRNHLHPALHRVQDAIGQQPQADWSLQRMADVACTSARHVSRLFMAHAGVAPLVYLRSIRLDLAEAALRSGHSVTQAAELAGFHSDTQLRRTWHQLGKPGSPARSA
jgi:transcriptional regulator GlxA family with amidase domain